MSRPSIPTTLRTMPCYLTSEHPTDPVAQGDFEAVEESYRSYARLFDRVRLVLTRPQARERLLAYPHVVSEAEPTDRLEQIRSALDHTNAESIFVGDRTLTTFSPELVLELVRNYNGEAYLGYEPVDSHGTPQPWFGIFRRDFVASLLERGVAASHRLTDRLTVQGRRLPLPSVIASA